VPVIVDGEKVTIGFGGTWGVWATGRAPAPMWVRVDQSAVTNQTISAWDFGHALISRRNDERATTLNSLRTEWLLKPLTDCESFHIIDMVVPGPTSAEYDPRGFPSPETVAQRKTSCSPSLSFQMKALPEYKGQERAFSQVRPVRLVRPVRRVPGTCIRGHLLLGFRERKRWRAI